MARTSRELTWFARQQPQTLQGAVLLLYWNAALSAIYALVDRAGVPAILILVDLFAGIGLANDRRWGFLLGLAAGLAPVVLFFSDLHVGSVLNLLFWLALLALLLHPQSRQYVRTYFH